MTTPFSLFKLWKELVLYLSPGKVTGFYGVIHEIPRKFTGPSTIFECRSKRGQQQHHRRI